MEQLDRPFAHEQARALDGGRSRDHGHGPPGMLLPRVVDLAPFEYDPHLHGLRIAQIGRSLE